MSHSSPPGAATSLTTAHCTKPEFQVEEESWGGGWREPWLWRVSKKLLGEQPHLQSRLPCTSFPGWNLWAYISTLITDEYTCIQPARFPTDTVTHGHLLKGRDNSRCISDAAFRLSNTVWNGRTRVTTQIATPYKWIGRRYPARGTQSSYILSPTLNKSSIIHTIILF